MEQFIESLRLYEKEAETDAWMMCGTAADVIEILFQHMNAISCQDTDCKDEGIVWCATKARTALAKARAALGEGKE